MNFKFIYFGKKIHAALILLLLLLLFPLLSFSGGQAGSPVKGALDGHVTIVEFSDFQCSYCAKVESTIDKVLNEYKTEAKLIYKHFPLTLFHKDAFKAALAAEAARKQGKFWEMHDKMFNNQKNLKEEDLLKYASELNLDIEAFKKALVSSEVKEIVERDMQTGKEFGVLATPTFFVNGKMVFGNKPFEVFKDVIDEELGRKKK